MKKGLLSFALIAMALGVNAQVGVKTVTTSNGTTTKASSEVVQQKSSRAIISDAEVVWHHNEEYAIGGNAWISDEVGNVVINWEVNDKRFESFSENGISEWNYATESDWPFTAANKAGSPLLKQNHLSYTTSNKQSSKQLATHACFCHLLSAQNSYAMCMP